MISPVMMWIESLRTPGGAGLDLLPKTASMETGQAYLYTVQLPDVAREQIMLNVKDGMLILSIADLEDGHEERFQNLFSYSDHPLLHIPVCADATAARAEFKDGVLSIAIPKASCPTPPHSSRIHVL